MSKELLAPLRWCWVRLPLRLQRFLQFMTSFAVIAVPSIATLLALEARRLVYVPLLIVVVVATIATQAMAYRQYRRVVDLLNPIENSVSTQRRSAATVLLNALLVSAIPSGMKSFEYRVYTFNDATQQFDLLYGDKKVDETAERTPWRRDTGVIGAAWRKAVQVEEEGESCWNGHGIPEDWRDQLKDVRSVIATPCLNGRGRPVAVLIATQKKKYKKAAAAQHEEKLQVLRRMADASARIVIDILGTGTD